MDITKKAGSLTVDYDFTEGGNHVLVVGTGERGGQITIDNILYGKDAEDAFRALVEIKGVSIENKDSIDNLAGGKKDEN